MNKEYVNLTVLWGEDGSLTPVELHLEGGGHYVVDRVLSVCPLASRKSGGFGTRYTVRASCAAEGPYGKV